VSNQTISFWYTRCFRTIAIYIFACIIVLGTILEIDHELFSTLGDNVGKKDSKINRNAKQVTPNKLAKCLKMYTPYLLLRRTHWNPDEKRFVPEPEILFCSNAFTPGKSLFAIMCALFNR